MSTTAETMRITVEGNCMDDPPKKPGWKVRFVACRGHRPGDTITWTYEKVDEQ
jgi:hypothetical protein